MKYKLFKKKMQGRPYFTSAIFKALATNEKTVHNQIVSWIKNGDVVKLRRGFFTLSDQERKVGLSKKLIANTIYSPSYISLEFALSFYGMIPEAVFSVTSVTTKKTQKFTNTFGEFLYKSIKKEFFFGFQTTKDEFGFDCFLATPEKALLDYLYFNVSANTKINNNFFGESLRLQNLELLDLEKIQKMAKKIGSTKINKMVTILGKQVPK